MSDSNPPQAANDDTETEIVGASPSSSSSATQADCADDPEIVELLKFDPAPRLVKRPDGWTAERQRCFIRLIVETGSPQRAAAAMGKKLSGLEQVYRSEGAEGFREAWDRAVAIAAERETRRLSRIGAGSIANPPHWRRRGRWQADPEPTGQETEASEDMKWDLMLNIAGKFMKKVAAEREARLNGEIVAADFYLRQITVLETTFDLVCGEFGWDARETLRRLRRGEHGILDIVSTPFADWLDAVRREWWAREGEPERPACPDVRFAKRRQSAEGSYATAQDMYSGPWADPPPGVQKEEWLKLGKAEQLALIAQIREEHSIEQAEWERRAHEEWAERMSSSSETVV